MNKLLTFYLNEEPETIDIEYIYTLKQSEQFGLSLGGAIIAGYELVSIQGSGYDLIHEEIVNIGDTINETLIIPKEGLIVGKNYRAIVTNQNTDWETGAIDDYDIELIEVNI